MLLLEIYHTLSRRKELFEPLDGRLVRMYVCGITPYDVGHLGHALTYVVFDTVRRYLEFQSFAVRHVQNITDVDDDMVRVSRELGTTIVALTDKHHALFLQEMDALHVLRPDAYPRVSQTIPEIIELIRLLIDGGHGYVADGHVFFDAGSAPDFGALSGKSTDELRAAPRTDTMPDEPEALKRDPLDFLLWQPSDYPGASFPSPWGEGRAGLAHRVLGDGARYARRPDRHPRWRARPDLPAPRVRDRAVSVRDGGGAVRALLDARRDGHARRRQDVQVARQPREGERAARAGPHGGRDPAGAARAPLPGRAPVAAPRSWTSGSARRRRCVARCKRRAGRPDQLRVQPRRNAFMEALDDDFDTPRAIEILLAIAAAIEAGRLDGATAIPTLVELGGVLGLRLGCPD